MRSFLRIHRKQVIFVPASELNFGPEYCGIHPSDLLRIRINWSVMTRFFQGSNDRKKFLVLSYNFFASFINVVRRIQVFICNTKLTLALFIISHSHINLYSHKRSYYFCFCFNYIWKLNHVIKLKHMLKSSFYN